MVSVILTSKNESKSIQLAVKSITPQLKSDDELIIVSPDKIPINHLTRSQNKRIKLVKDMGVGKPAAVNLGLKLAKGNILVLTDGDVHIGEQSLEGLIRPFDNTKVGAVSGHPISEESKNHILGYWSHLLTDIAHKIRLGRVMTNQFIECSGYLYAFRTGLVKAVPEDSLAEDAVISHIIANQGYKITYSPNSDVFVKYPRNYSDWLKQKIRSAGGYTQDYIKKSNFSMRTFTSEVLGGLKFALKYPKNVREVTWTILLFLARVHLWLLILIRIKLLHSSFSSVWVRVESTK